MKALLLAACMLAAAPAFADNKAEAVALFDEASKDFKAGNFEKACAAFKKSNELHPDSGTRGSLARCYEKLGKVVSAWKLWVDLSTTAPVALRPDAAARAQKLEPRLSKVAIKHDAGVTVLVNGARFEGGDQAIDPGTYPIVASADGFEAWNGTVTVVEGKTETVTVPALKKIVVQQQIDTQPAPIEGRPAAKSSRKTIGYVSIGVGGALVGTALVLGYVAKSRYDDANDICGGDVDVCSGDLAAAQDKVDSARTMGNVSTVTAIVGAAAVVTGIVLVVTAPKRKSGVAIAPAVGSDGGGIVVTGGF